MSWEFKVFAKKLDFVTMEILGVVMLSILCHKVPLKCPSVHVEKAESFTSFFSACGSEQNNWY